MCGHGNIRLTKGVCKDAKMGTPTSSPRWRMLSLNAQTVLQLKKLVNLRLFVVFCAGYGLHWFNLAGIKAFPGKTLSCHPSTQNQ